MPTPRQKLVFILIEEHQYSQRAAAEMMGLSESRVSRLLSDTLKKYAAMQSMSPDVPERQRRRVFLGSN